MDFTNVVSGDVQSQELQKILPAVPVAAVATILGRRGFPEPEVPWTASGASRPERCPGRPRSP